MKRVIILSKNGNGEGSIRKRRDGLWEARYTAGYDYNGKQKQKSIYGKTRQEVQKKLTKINANINDGTYIEPNKIKLNEWLLYWLKNYAQNKIRPSTYSSYETYILKHIHLSFNENLRLNKLTTNDLQLFFNDKYRNGRLDGKGGLSPKTLKNMYNMFHEALQQAVTNKLIYSNPIKGVTLPKNKKPDIKTFNESEVLKICNIAKSERLGFAITFVFKTGLRIGEVCGLKWSVFDFEKNVFKINNTLQRVQKKKSELKEGENKTYIIEGEPKTQNSIRTIPLSTNTVKQLLEYRERQNKEKALLGIQPNETDYVFANEFGRYIEPSYLRKLYNKILKKAEIKHLNFHCIRHTYATIMIDKGVDVKSLSELLGHSSVEITMNLYCHPSLDTKRKAVDKLDEIFDI